MQAMANYRQDQKTKKGKKGGWGLAFIEERRKLGGAVSEQKFTGGQ